MNIEQTAARRSPALTRSLVAACALFSALHAFAAPGAEAPAASQAASHAAAHGSAAGVFAKVGEVVITHQDFEAAFAQAARGKFYHGKPPQEDVAKLQREVGQNLVDEILLEKEAKRRKLGPDQAVVDKAIAEYDERYRDSAQWKANRAGVLPGLKAKLEHDNVQERLQAQVKAVGEPTAAQLQEYYAAHQDKFTSPEQVHLRLILLKVNPSSPQAQWDAAREEGKTIVQRLQAGADFADLAKVHSGDASAERGGDLGFVHRGMLPEGAEAAVDKLQPGQTSDVVQVLEGIAILRLEARKQPVLNPLEAVRPRLRDLYLRDRSEEAWTAFLAKLRRDTPVQRDESRFLPLAQAGGNAPAR
jgi:parvulin-like peptidyl-prolyl isomerase